MNVHTPESGHIEPIAIGGAICIALLATVIAGCAGPAAVSFGAFFPKRIDVFGVSIRGTTATPDDKMLHAAHVMAEYLDNDADGRPDNAAVVSALQSRNATLVMTIDRDELDDFRFDQLPDGEFQDLNAAETRPGGADRWEFDASLEEVLHLITHVGYANAYPEIFGESPGTSLGDAMDIARGGRFMEIPSTYPESAWYSYDDHTCDYNCMAAEYIYWAITSVLGAQEFPGRLEEIEHEWRLNTAQKVAERDPAVYGLISDPKYRLPTKLPSGGYRGGQIEFNQETGLVTD